MFEYWLQTDLQRLPTVKPLGNVFSQDSGANKIGVIVTDGGEAAELSGTIRANVVKPDGSTIQVTGEASGNRAWVILPAAAYTAVGQIGVYLKLITENETTTLGGVEGYVNKSR